jgi:hypothetical protein
LSEDWFGGCLEITFYLKAEDLYLETCMKICR